MSGTLAGFEHYRAAPEAVELPEWLLREEQLWAHVNGECRPVAIEGGGQGWRLEHTTCVVDGGTCGVTVKSEGDDATAHQWCGSSGVGWGPVDGDRLRLVAADEEHAAYMRIVGLAVVPIGLRGELHQCTGKSLRELERRDELPPSSAAPPDPVAALYDHRIIWMGNRACLFVEGFAVEEARHGPPFSWPEGSWRAVSVPGRWDCIEPCPSRPQLVEYVGHVTAIASRDFLPPRPVGLDLFRTFGACAAATDTPPSVLGRNLGATVGACLR